MGDRRKWWLSYVLGAFISLLACFGSTYKVFWKNHVPSSTVSETCTVNAKTQ